METSFKNSFRFFFYLIEKQVRHKTPFIFVLIMQGLMVPGNYRPVTEWSQDSACTGHKILNGKHRFMIDFAFMSNQLASSNQQIFENE